MSRPNRVWPCQCKGAKVSSVESLLLVCRAQEKKGNLRCKGCKTLKSNGLQLPDGTEIVPSIMERAELILDAAKLPVADPAAQAAKVKVRRKKKSTARGEKE